MKTLSQHIQEKLVINKKTDVIKPERIKIPTKLPQNDLHNIDEIYQGALAYAKEHKYNYDNGLDKIQEYIDKHLDNKYKTKEWIWGYITITLGYDYCFGEDDENYEQGYLDPEWEDQDPVNELAVRVSEDVVI